MKSRLPYLAMSALMLVNGCRKPAITFDADRAFADLKRQVAFGPRIPGTAAYLRCRQWLVDQLAQSGGNVQQQAFTGLVGGRRVEMRNVIAVYRAGQPRTVMLCAHYDTRPLADQAETAKERAMPVPGANDGASGVAVLLELARMIQAAPLPYTVVIALWDGEDTGPETDNMFLGSRWYARKPVGPRPDFAVLLDMVGDADLQIYREQFSQDAAPWLVDAVWRCAKRAGYERHFVDSVGYAVMDDHVPLIDAGIPAIDVIDFQYPWWHTPYDLPERCSAASLKAVGETMWTFLTSEAGSLRAPTRR